MCSFAQIPGAPSWEPHGWSKTAHKTRRWRVILSYVDRENHDSMLYNLE